MSDEEEQYTEEEEEEIEEETADGGASEAAEAEPASEVPTSPRVRRPPPPKPDEKDEVDLSEAEAAMLAAKRRKEEEAALSLLDYEERRRIEREREEEELRLLKQRQEERKKQREEEEREFAERMKKEEERRRAEEEERRAKLEAERRRREEKKMKSQEMMQGIIGTQGQGPNFKIEKTGDKTDKFSNIVQAKQEMKMTKEQQEEAKRSFIAGVQKTLPNLAEMMPNDLKEAIKKLHAKIARLESDKYDLEKRAERQEYDLKELTERQRQAARVKAAEKGVDPADANSRYPPKKAIVSRFDRQIDRRSFSQRRAMFAKDTAFPVFPNVPPPPVILEFKIAPEPTVKREYDYYEEEEE